MEKQKSFSIKPIRYLVISFTISFSLIFLVFICTLVFKTIPSSHLDTRSIRLNSSSIVHSSRDENTSSENVVKTSILLGTHLREDEVSSRVAINVSNLGSAQKRKSEATVLLTDAESKPGLLNGNFSSVDSVNASIISESAVDYSLGLGPVILGVDSVNSTTVDGEFEKLNDGFDENSSAKQRISESEAKDKGVCDITKGKWVIDERYPLYTTVSCPFIDEGFNCEANGRLDKHYMKWRWQPQDCDVPRFNATKMLELIRGKRLVFVGDSINRNQWESMLCLLMGAVKDQKKVYETHHRKITKSKGDYCFKFEDYKCTVEYYVTHFLVHESKARVGKKRVQTLRVDAMDKGSSRWRGADILVFNTAHWWNHQKTKAGVNYYQDRDQVYPRLEVTTAFKKALLTWASWVDKFINPRKTKIFFRSSSPSHFSGGMWNTGGHCKEAFQPINQTFVNDYYPEKNLIVEEIIGQMKTPVTFLNITRLSDYRADAHPSVYGSGNGNRGVEDCSHWCLPGVPDNWNELLYYYLQLEHKTNLL